MAEEDRKVHNSHTNNPGGTEPDEVFHHLFDVVSESSKENLEHFKSLFQQVTDTGKEINVKAALSEMLTIMNSHQFITTASWVILSMLWHRKDDRKENIELLNRLIASLYDWKDDVSDPVIKRFKEILDEYDKMR